VKHQTVSGRIFDMFNYLFMALLAFITLYPFWDTLIVSIIPLEQYLASSIHIFPQQLTFEAYAYLFSMKELWRSYGVTIYITVIGTAINMLLTIMAAYALSKRDLKGQTIIMVLIVFTMMFSGGLIPSYLVVKNLGMVDTLWALIIPSAINTYNLIIMRNFFGAIPDELEDSAKIDGCNDMGILFKIIIPLSMPSIATITLFYAVARWNEFFSAVFYINSKQLWPLQLFLRAMLFENEASSSSGGDSPFLLGVSIKMAAVMAATIPVIMIYPFFQKFFVKGAMIGAVKE
jgi:putative aldouronate transport system permease protein